MTTTAPTRTVFGGRGDGCPICQATRPPVQTSYRPDGTTVRQQQCGLCGKVWGYEEMTRAQAVAWDTISAIGQVMRDVAAAIERDGHAAPGTGTPCYEAVMAEVETLHGPDVAEQVNHLLRALRESVARSHAARATGARHPG